MYRQLFCTILLASSFVLQLNCTLIDFNVTNAVLSLNSLLKELKAEKAQIREELNSLRSEQAQIRREVDDLRLEKVLKQTALDQQRLPSLDCCSSGNKKSCDILIPSYNSNPFEVPCEDGWIVVLRRQDGSVYFQRNWKTYKMGFGEIDGEYFIGLDRLHALTADRSMELLFILEDSKGVIASESYERFAIGNEEEQYILHTLGVANGTAGDSLRQHFGMKFTTIDRDNDNRDENCAEIRVGGWWYNKCFACHLTGTYGDNAWAMGIKWNAFHENDSLKRAVMLIRPRK